MIDEINCKLMIMMIIGTQLDDQFSSYDDWWSVETFGDHENGWGLWQFGQDHFDPCSLGFSKQLSCFGSWFWSAISWWIFIRVLKLLTQCPWESRSCPAKLREGLILWGHPWVIFEAKLGLSKQMVPPNPMVYHVKLPSNCQKVRWIPDFRAIFHPWRHTEGWIAVTWTIATPRAKKGWELWTRHPACSKGDEGSPGCCFEASIIVTCLIFCNICNVM